MNQTINLIVGDWYKASDSDPFRVIDIDDDAETIEIQYLNGDIAELEFESTPELNLQEVAAPEGVSDPFENMEQSDFEEGSRHYDDMEDVWSAVDHME